MNKDTVTADYATELVRQGKYDAAEQAWKVVLESAPDNLPALIFLGARTLHSGRTVESVSLSERAFALAPRNPAVNSNLGRALLRTGNCERALWLFERVLAGNPNSPTAHLCKGIALERLGRFREAATSLHTGLMQGNADGALNDLESLPPNLRELATDAADISRKCRHDILNDCMKPLRKRYGQDALKRIEACMAIYLRETQPNHPHPQQYPTFLFIPGLPAQPFYEDHSPFPWLAELEGATVEIRDELIQVLQTDAASFHPVVSEFTGAAAEYWHEVNDSMSWNGLYFYRHGERLDENCARCPKTAALLDRLPLIREPGHSPEAHFSVLQPGAHIPIHTGVVNARIVVHLPLIIPPDCGIRIAGEVHDWNEGRTLAFDDTFEHEAWNHSDKTRVVLIMDTWNPYLSEAEREAFSTLVQTISNTPLLSTRPDATSGQ